ncbi:MAG: hypothetical protein II453_07680 [Alphaproteobacteria bacterium]|nr:hypothetical protein [Alphaproteobacteria bacterium]
MTITELQEPIWKKQKKEGSNAYCWFQEYLNYPTFELMRFCEYIQQETEESQQKTVKKVKTPTYNTLCKWSSKFKWRKRKEAYLENEEEERTLYLRQLRLKHSREELDLLHEIKMTQLKNIRDQIQTGQKSGYDFNQNMQGIKVINDMDLLELGEATENINQKIQADVQTISKKEKIREVDELAKEIQEVIDNE